MSEMAWDLKKPYGDIDFAAIEQWIVAHSGMHYIKPEKSMDNAEDMEQVKDLGTNARKLFIEYGNRVLEKLPDFIRTSCSGWVNQGQIVPDYLWMELKRKGYEDRPFSISITILKEDNDVKLYVCVEAKDIACKKGDLDQFNKMIYEKVPENSGCYFDGEDELGNYEIIGNSQEEAIIAYEAGKYKKIRIIKVIDGPYEASRTEHIVNDTIDVINKLMPNYNSIFKSYEGGTDMDKVTDFEKNLILYGPPGTGKTYNTTIYAVAICDGKSLQEVENMGYEAMKKRYNELMEKENRIAFTTFHQSYGYEEFIEGIRPVMEEDVDAGGLQYKVVPGVFKAFCEKAKEDKIQAPTLTVEKNEKPYVFIIDEINRGNISKIFGELITLMEETKRLGEVEAMTAILPYSGPAHPFGIPKNVYILGTMNTADRSIALMDTALRRRFHFIEMMPKDEILQGILVEENGIQVNVQSILKAINDRIEFLFDREHTIGHAFFCGLRKDPSLKRLSDIFKKSVVPLLQEYFYDDYEKIQLVLGDTGKSDARFRFILNEEVAPNKIFRGRTNLEKEQKYRIQESAFDFIESYEGILNSEE